MGDLNFTRLDDHARVWFSNAAAWNTWFESITVNVDAIEISATATIDIAGAVKQAESLNYLYTFQDYGSNYYNSFDIQTTEGLKTFTSITKDSFDKLKINVDEIKAILDELKANMIAAGQLEA